MPKRPKPGYCTHCLRHKADLTWDHVFPVSWYPNAPLDNAPKWKVPSCSECNNKLGVIEKDLLIRIGICLNPNDPGHADIFQKAMRSILPRYAKSEKDYHHRARKLSQLMAQVKRGDTLKGTYPNFGFHPELPANEQVGISLPVASLKAVGEKIVKGIVLHEQKRLLPQGAYEIAIHVLEREAFDQIFVPLAPHAVVYDHGPGLRATWVLAPEDPCAGIYGFTIWEKWRFYASVLPIGAQLDVLTAGLLTQPLRNHPA